MSFSRATVLKVVQAYFNHGLINYIYGQKRLLPCDMAFDTFSLTLTAMLCRATAQRKKEVMGNLNEQSWDELWNSEQAENVRKSAFMQQKLLDDRFGFTRYAQVYMGARSVGNKA